MFAEVKQVDYVPGQKNDQDINDIISFYNEPPSSELSLDEFELFALDRLQLLRNIENFKIKGLEEDRMRSSLVQAERRYIISGVDELRERKRKDVASHYILRLAFCRSQDLRNWFIDQESTLFKHRLEGLTDAKKMIFMQKNGLDYKEVSAEEKNALLDKLSGFGSFSESIILEPMYRIPFQQAIRLIASRSVHLENGFAFVPFKQIVAIIMMRFRLHLSKALAEAATTFGIINADSRIAPFLKNLNKQYVGNDFSKPSSVDKLTPDKVDEAADIHMPLCMRNLQSALKKDHKLKHWGRLQYGLFLKGAGLELEDALRFFESHFGKVMTHDQFVKDYSYSFRHMYGKEGNRKNYTSYSCMKIILGAPPQPGQVHGCPYKHATDGQLAAMLSSLKLASNDVKEIVQLAKGGGHYQVACQRHFDLVHPDYHKVVDSRSTDAAANHPNAWFNNSVSYHKAKTNPSQTKQAVAVSPTAVAHGPDDEQMMMDAIELERSTAKRAHDEIDDAAHEAMLAMEE